VAKETLIIDFWDVGQGDGTTIRLPDDWLLLIDTGLRGSPIVDWLTVRRPSIHAIVVTHNDEDHAGGLPSVVKIPSLSIQSVYMLADRDVKSSKFRNIWQPVREEEQKRRFSVERLETDMVLWQSADTCLKVVYPTFSENVEANRPNESSTVICLLHRGKVKIIWPGDAPMQVVAEKCAGTFPHLLHGPYHGGPVDRKKTGFKGWVEATLSERVFISVGTSNSYNLPSQDYLVLQTDRGCQITCTELTSLCDRTHISSRKPVLQTAALLGLPAARTGVPCRGCFRITVQDGNFIADAWDAEHLTRIKLLKRPQCFVRT
jgi:beta-lactamase superfamily II metal-dependent hydrolase